MTDAIVRIEGLAPGERVTREEHLHPGLMLEEVTPSPDDPEAPPFVRCVMVWALRYNFAWFDIDTPNERFVIEPDDERTFVAAVQLGETAVPEVFYLEEVDITPTGHERPAGEGRPGRHLRTPLSRMEAAASSSIAV